MAKGNDVEELNHDELLDKKEQQTQTDTRQDKAGKRRKTKGNKSRKINENYCKRKKEGKLDRRGSCRKEEIKKVCK